jgi:hypothetical protein
VRVLSRICPETPKKLRVHEFGFRRKKDLTMRFKTINWNTEEETGRKGVEMGK